MMWVSGHGFEPVASYRDLEERVSRWDGTLPPAEMWTAALSHAEALAEAQVAAMADAAKEHEHAGLQRQLEAARLRLLKELGRYLVAHNFDAANLNTAMYSIMKSGGPSGERVRRVFHRFGDMYPVWDLALQDDLRAFRRTLPPNRQRSRQIGVELEAALQDPRWQASVNGH